MEIDSKDSIVLLNDLSKQDSVIIEYSTIGGTTDNQVINSKDENRWKDPIQILLEEYRNRLEYFRDPTTRKRPLWEQIAEALKTRANFTSHPLSLDQKFRNLKTTYRNIKRNNRKKPIRQRKITWKYYDIFEEICATDKDQTIADSSSDLELSHDGSSNGSRSNSPCTVEEQNRIVLFRKRQLDLEDEKIKELRKMRLAMEENNRIKRQQLELLKKYLKIN